MEEKKAAAIRQESINEESTVSGQSKTTIMSSSSSTEAGESSCSVVHNGAVTKGTVKADVHFSSSTTSTSTVSTVTHRVVAGVETRVKENPKAKEGESDNLVDIPTTLMIGKSEGSSRSAKTEVKERGENQVEDDEIFADLINLDLQERETDTLETNWSPKHIENDDGQSLSTFLRGELKKRDKILEDFLLLNPVHSVSLKAMETTTLVPAAACSSAEELRSELAGSSVKIAQLEDDLRETRTTLSKREGRLQELTRQLDAHRQEHARQAATIVSLRQRLQDESDLTSRLRGQQRRTELSLTAITRENKQNQERIMELENRIRTHLEERESAEQRSEASQKRLFSLLQMASSALSIESGLQPQNAHEKLSAKLAELVQECGFLRGEVSRMTEEKSQLEESLSHSRQTVTRLVKELDDEKDLCEKQKAIMDDFQKENDTLRCKGRSLEEEVKSIKERLHSSNKSYNDTVEELHNAEKELQQAKDEAMVSEHRRLQAEAEWKGFLNTLSALLSTPSDKVAVATESLIEKVQTVASCAKESTEQAERLTAQMASLEEQNRRQSELYNSALKRARQSDSECQSLSLRVKHLEAEINRIENTHEAVTTEKDKAVRLMSRVVDALGLKELGEEVTRDAELVVCRAQQLAKLEGEKIVDKTTTVYQLQRRVKSLREAVERKDLHVDMLRRKLAMTEDAARDASHLAAERDETLGRCRRLNRTVERLQGELADARHQIRDLREQMADNSDDKVKIKQLTTKVEELSSKITELDTLRARHQKKINQLREQVKVFGEHTEEERRVHETSLDGFTQELTVTKHALREATRREKQLFEFRRSILEVLGCGGDDSPGGCSDIEALNRLEKLLSAHRELNDLSRRLDDLTTPSRPSSARHFPSHSFLHAHLRPSSPQRPSSALPILPSHERSSPSEFSIPDLPEEEFHFLIDAPNNQRPTALKSRPSSARSRTPSPIKPVNSPNSSDGEDS